MSGNIEAKAELNRYNLVDLTTSAMTLSPTIVSKMSSVLYGTSLKSSLVDTSGVLTYEKAVMNSDDLFDTYQVGKWLTKDGLADDLTKEVVGYGDYFANKFYSVTSYSDDIIDLVNLSEKNSDDIVREFKIVTKHRPDADVAQLDSLYKVSLKSSTRALNVADDVADAVIKTKVKNFRSMLGKKTMKTGNVGYALTNIENVTPEIYGYSGFNDMGEALSNGAKIDETTIKVAWLPENSSFTAYGAPNNEGKIFNRIYDSEYKILSEIDKQLNGNTAATGKIILFTELKCCESCTDVIIQFSEKYPNIEIEVIYNNSRLKVN